MDTENANSIGTAVQSNTGSFSTIVDPTTFEALVRLGFHLELEEGPHRNSYAEKEGWKRAHGTMHKENATLPPGWTFDVKGYFGEDRVYLLDPRGRVRGVNCFDSLLGVWVFKLFRRYTSRTLPYQKDLRQGVYELVDILTEEIVFRGTIPFADGPSREEARKEIWDHLPPTTEENPLLAHWDD